VKKPVERPSSPSPAAPAEPRRRYRIERLEERVAPKRKGTGPGDSGGGFSKSIY
jgi:hypothetical protein